MSTPDCSSILVVDDDDINRVLLSTLLEDQGYRVRTAVDGTEALRALEEEPFDTVLLDVVMPGVDGIEVLQTVKRSSRFWDIPVLMVSSVEETTSIVRCLELGAADFFSKPFDPVILRAKVSGCLARKRAHDLEVEYQKTVKEHAASIEELNRELARRARHQGAKAERLARLRRCLPSRLAEQALASGEELARAARRRSVAVVSAALSERAPAVEPSDPMTIFAVADEFHRAVDGLAATVEATMTSSPGWTVTLLLNDLRPCPDATRQAVRLGGVMAEMLGDLAAGWRADHGLTVAWGVGVAVGEATIGMVEYRGRADYWALGPVVDRAVTLARSADGGVLVDEAVL